ncbi:MAG: selenocysteine-specific translation elongation factor [Pyrinomonadaceae bacterium]
MDRIVGTAGHIDHGKTALVKALTGVDADRLPDEKRRGITIDLGFADMAEGDLHFGFVDVPGHERFVRNMLAGASGIDLVLLVVAADEGVMPQTREHFEICRLLGIEHGIVVLTKSDLADAETMELARLDVAELVAGSFLEDAPVIAVSSKTGDGIDELKRVLARSAHARHSRDDRFATFLPVDRSFSVRGFGTVVTGTLFSGAIGEGDELVLLPVDLPVRVRGVQSHGEPAKKVGSGRRTAVNLVGVDQDKVSRGMVLTARDSVDPTQLLDCEIEMLKNIPRPLRTRQRVRVHIGTSEVLARVQVLNEAAEITAGETDLVQLRLESPIAALPGHRLIIRSYSPQVTIGGGMILDIGPLKHRRRDLQAARDFLGKVGDAHEHDTDSVDVLVQNSALRGMTAATIRKRTGLTAARVAIALEGLVESGAIKQGGGRYVGSDRFAEIENSVLAGLTAFHQAEPLAPRMSREALVRKLPIAAPEVSAAVLVELSIAGKILQDGDGFSLASHSTKLTGDGAKASAVIAKTYTDGGLEVPRLDEVLANATAGTRVSRSEALKLLHLLISSGAIVKVTDEFYFSRATIDGLVSKLRSYAATTPDRLIDVPKFKQLTGVSRKYAIPLLEYLDGERVTRRAGDKRVII